MLFQLNPFGSICQIRERVEYILGYWAGYRGQGDPRRGGPFSPFYVNGWWAGQEHWEKEWNYPSSH